MNYKVDAGLYALGRPDDKSSVLVTANYKLSFDTLRSALRGRNLWILVLDTDGINVWCAAGKGTFSTNELVRRIESSGLERWCRIAVLQPQRRLAWLLEVKRLSGFKVINRACSITGLTGFH
jgi:acetyl-CoA decarbonylase/synthase complex subunit gamma